MRSAPGGLVLVVLLAMLGCVGSEDGDTAADACAADEETTAHTVGWATDPAEASAGEESIFTAKIRDQRGCPIEDLQRAHERMLHTLFISQDLASFQHLHQEDSAELTATDLRDSTFHFPVTLPTAGEYRLVFDYAHENQYLASDDWMTVGGAPAQAAAPVLDYTTERAVGGLVVSLRWDVEPAAGYESAWNVTIRTESGEDVTDLVQWLGADAHAAVASADLGFVSHTHAWFPGMEDLAPSHEMPVFYTGPDLPFHYTFPTAGAHKMWIQFARADAPDAPYVADFAFDVAP